MENSFGATKSNLHNVARPQICRGDFDSHTTMCDVAGRIADDLRYENYWRKIAANKELYRRGGIK